MMCEVVEYIRCPRFVAAIPRALCKECRFYDTDDGRGHWIYCNYNGVKKDV